MSEFAELRAILLQRAVPLDRPLDMRGKKALLDWADGFISVSYSLHATEGHCDLRSDGGMHITLPVTPVERIELKHFGHEAGHAFTRHAGLLLPGEVPGTAKQSDERDAQVFADALLLPRRTITQYLRQAQPDLYGLIEDVGCDRETLERRLRWNEAHTHPSLKEPPPWSAWWQYRVRLERTQLNGAVTVRPIEGMGRFSFPYTNEREMRQVVRQVQWALAALRPHEFALKYQPHRIEVSDAGLTWDELRQSHQFR